MLGDPADVPHVDATLVAGLGEGPAIVREGPQRVELRDKFGDPVLEEEPARAPNFDVGQGLRHSPSCTVPVLRYTD